MINPPRLAKAIVHWIEFEVLCQRGNLLSEGSMTIPVGQFLNTNMQRRVECEYDHPTLNRAKRRGRPKQIDFVIRDGSDSHIEDAIEAKWITGKRDYKQEVVDDVVRLELVHTPDYKIGRWLLLAGKYSDLQRHVLEATGRQGRGGSLVVVFNELLHRKLGVTKKVMIRTSNDPIRRLWKGAQDAFGIELPHLVYSRFAAQFPENPDNNDYVCLIWHIRRMLVREMCTL